MFWGNWLHSLSFTLGLAAICLAAAIFTGAVTRNFTIGIALFVVLIIADLLFFWTFLGWLALHQFIWNLLHPGDMPGG